MNLKFIKVSILSLCAVGAASSMAKTRPAEATENNDENSSQGYVGIPLGVAFGTSVVSTNTYATGFSNSTLATNVSYGPRFLFGLEGGFKFTPEFGIGAFFKYSSKSGVSFLPFGLEGNYYFQGSAVGAYLGLNLGLVHQSIDPTQVSLTNTGYVATYGQVYSYSQSNLMVGIQGGYDRKVAEHFTVGGKVVYDAYFNSAYGQDPTQNNALTQGLLNSFEILADARYWF